MKKWLWNFGLALFFVVAAGCGGAAGCVSLQKGERISVLNWNLQTFFDGNFDGNEYTEFKSSSSGWSKDKYSDRLDRLCSVIKKLDKDVVVMEELEKEGQLYDISNRLAGAFKGDKVYRYAFFAKDEGSSIGLGILSRYPLAETSVHVLDIRSEKTKQPAMRPIVKCSVLKGQEKLVLFVNHWKSKSGGEAESEVWRNYQEECLCSLVSQSLAEGERFVLMCGDFNRDILEFSQMTGGINRNIVLRGENVPVYSPWFDENGQLWGIGSYFYDEQWSRIDNFFSAGDAVICDFKVESGGAWADSQGRPVRYKVYTGQGYSDHLPVSCSVLFE